MTNVREKKAKARNEKKKHLQETNKAKRIVTEITWE